MALQGLNLDRARVLHAIDGRLRIKVSSIKKDAERARALCDALRDIRGVQRAIPNLVTGSITITYDHTIVDGSAVCRELARIVGDGASPAVGADPIPVAPLLAQVSPALIANAGNSVMQVILKTAMEAALKRAIYALI